MWFVGVEVEQETSAPPPKKSPGSAPAIDRFPMKWSFFIRVDAVWKPFFMARDDFCLWSTFLWINGSGSKISILWSNTNFKQMVRVTFLKCVNQIFSPWALAEALSHVTQPARSRKTTLTVIDGAVIHSWYSLMLLEQYVVWLSRFHWKADLK